LAVRLTDKYFDWLVDIVAVDNKSFTKLFAQLHEIPFTYSIPLDRNRAFDGRDLRYRFTCDYNCPDYALDSLPSICSVFEMMIALSVRCEEYIADDPTYGNRTAQWFWRMISSLGLNGMYDSNYDQAYVQSVITRFLNREYSPDGRGGLFAIKNCEFDPRTVQIWHQMLRYLDDILLRDI
jgi:hypothetical protein